ncbi:MAG: cardiolipin synthase [Clostridia bacterium]|nr:cardiolipin synthase [Clostridia bacterium]
MRKLCRIIFSRYAVSALMILFSLGLLSYVIFFASAYSVYAFVLMSVLDVFVIISIINRDMNPEYKIPWLVIALVIPFFGAALYVMFSSRRLSKREARFLRRINEAADIAADEEFVFAPDINTAVDSVEDGSAVGKIVSLLGDDPGAKAFSGTESEYFPLGELMLEQMLKDMSAAEKYIFLEYFIIEEGKMWEKILAVLTERARCGIDVRVLYDDIGSMKTLPANFPTKLSRLGIKCLRFSKVTPRVSVIHNNRDHRKICVIDGAVAYTGGINIADEYINEKERFGHWKDGGIRVSGYAALGFTKLFLSMWDFTVGGVSNYSEFFGAPRPSVSGDGGCYIPFGSGPAPVYARHSGKHAFLNLINQAHKYVYITTPYLIIDYTLTEALRCAALRGVEVVIITPSKADKRFVKVMTKSSYPALMEVGVKIYEYTPGFIHEKLLICDDLYAVVGSINFDYRSLVHHFEAALWIYKSPTVIRIREEFQKTQAVSAEIDVGEARLSFFERIVRNLIRLFAPLL